MKQDKKEVAQKYASLGIAGCLICFVAYRMMTGSPEVQRMGTLVNEEVSVFDELRTGEVVELKPDPLLDPVKTEAIPPAPSEASGSLSSLDSPVPAVAEAPQEAPVIPTPDPKPEPVAEKTKKEPSPAQECTEQEWRLGNCDNPGKKSAPARPSSGVTLASMTAEKQLDRPRTSNGGQGSYRSEPAPPHSGAADNSDMWMQMASGVKELKGAAPEYAGPVIKAHCRVLALIMDGVRVSDSQGASETITLNVKGPMPGCELPEIKGGLILGADATISPNRKWITARVSKCSDRSPRRPTRACKAVVESITGEDGLEGQIYDQSFFGSILEFGINAMGFVFLKDLAGSASKVENVWSASATVQIADSFQQMLAKGAAKVSEAFSGREIHLVRGAPVIVTFTEDVIL